MADTVRLLSVKGRAQLIERFYFYDGEVPIKDGIVEIPLDRPEWVQRAYIMGYRHDPVSEEVLTLAEALSGTRATPVTEETQATESTESAGDDVEGSDAGGQPVGEDRVREGEQPRADIVPEERLDSSVGDGVAVAEEGNDTPADTV